MAIPLLSFIIAIAFLINRSCPDPRTEVVARTCSKVSVQNVTNYIKYYSNITDYMHDELIRNKFAFNEVGKPPDRLYVLAQCMEDLSDNECDACFSRISTLVPGCFPNAGGRVYLDGCFMRADNYSFYAEAISRHDTKRCSGEVNAGQDFSEAVNKVVNELLKQAPSNRGFAMRHETSKDESAYGMAICWRTLDQDLCSACLSQAVTSALSCLPSTEARVLNAGCFLRFAHYSFANDQSEKAKEEILRYITYIVGVVVICLLAIGVGVFVGKFTYSRKNLFKKIEGTDEVDLLLDEASQFLQFKYATLEKATLNFDESHRLGRGGYGEVYKGILPDGREIAIKRLFVSRKSQIREICNEVDIISRAQHKNLVRFLGCCFTNTDSFLVYEFLANRSLDLILFDPAKKKELDWKKRLVILKGTAEGLEYLHENPQMRIIHRDIKASNILLDSRHKPKISDFGLARFHSCDKSHVNTAIAGTFGYMAPEYISEGRLTHKADVYSFGLLVLETLTGIDNRKFQSEDSYDTLATLAWKHFQSKSIPEIVDRGIQIEDMEEVERVVQIGLLCTQELPNLRPTMTKVVQMLRKKDFQLPTPSRPPFIHECMIFHSSNSDPRRSLGSDFCRIQSLDDS